MAASDKPFALYPTKEQLLAKPSAIVELEGVGAVSYANGQEITWVQGNWEFSGIGHAEQDGSRVARAILQALPVVGNLAPGATRGRFRAAQLGNPMVVTASWTYDGKTWYTLEGRSSPGAMVAMLRSITQLPGQ